jgi:hypothetical protein
MARNREPTTVQDSQRFLLKRKQFAHLAETAQLRFKRKQRREIASLCRTFLIERDFKRKAVSSTPATKFYKKLLELVTRLNKMLDELESDTTLMEEIYLDLDEELKDLYKWSNEPLVEMRYVLLALQNGVVRAAAQHHERYGGRGRPPSNEALRNFIWQLAHVFERAGGKASAWYDVVSEKRTSPFLRWVIALNEYLPEDARADPKKLPELVHEVCEKREKRRAKYPKTPPSSANTPGRKGHGSTSKRRKPPI